MTDKILIDRSVVEQALDVLEMMGTPSPSVFLPDEIKTWQNANEELRAALEHPDMGNPVSVPQGWQLVGWWHQVEDPDECDFFYADAINGDCPSCHPCYADIGGQK